MARVGGRRSGRGSRGGAGGVGASWCYAAGCVDLLVGLRAGLGLWDGAAPPSAGARAFLAEARGTQGRRKLNLDRIIQKRAKKAPRRLNERRQRDENEGHPQRVPPPHACHDHVVVTNRLLLFPEKGIIANNVTNASATQTAVSPTNH